MSYADFLQRAVELKVDGVSLETCFFESLDESYLKGLKERCDARCAAPPTFARPRHTAPTCTCSTPTRWVPWRHRRELRLGAVGGAQVEVPLILAGGLNPENVADGVAVARPFAVDVASGVESEPGVKDHARMAAFLERAQTASGALR